MPLMKKVLPWPPKVRITSEGTRYVDVDLLREAPKVRTTLELAQRMTLVNTGDQDDRVAGGEPVAAVVAPGATE